MQSSHSSKIVIISTLGISLHLILKYFLIEQKLSDIPLLIVLLLGGIPLVWILIKKIIHKEFGSDLLAGISILTSIVLGEHLAGSIVVLMLSSGEALEFYAMRNASSILKALAKRIPSIAHKKINSEILDININDIKAGDELLLYPHEICPVDGKVIEGRGAMDESYLTGEPFRMSKTIGSLVISGSINGNSLLTIRATKVASDSRYARIIKVVEASEKDKPKLRRLGDKLGAFYTPLAILVAFLAWFLSHNPQRFLAVLVVATPCPLIIAIPIAIIGSISLAAKRAIIIKKPIVLEQISLCETAIFDKTGTLTYGKPHLVDMNVDARFSRREILKFAASLEQYSKHPLAIAILEKAHEEKIVLSEASEVSEPPGSGLVGFVSGFSVKITGRSKLFRENFNELKRIPVSKSGLECIVLINQKYAGTLTFRDSPREDSKSFITHLGPKHQFKKSMIISGDRENEVRFLAENVGIKEIYFSKSPEEKLDLVKKETSQANTFYVGDGINDAPAMMASTVGIAMGQNSEVTTEAAGVVILESSLTKVDEFIHISHRMRKIALQSAIAGMFLSILGMTAAAFGYLTPINGAICQEVIDILAILNALRAAVPPRNLSDLQCS
jgi:heavy metal translocating P-type ATPase